MIHDHMPWGKHKHKLISDLPGSYLRWLSGLDDLSDWLRDAVAFELRRRKAADDKFKRDTMRSIFGITPEVDIPATKVKNVYRALARKWHPDRGGSTVAMQALNDFYHELLKGE